ncbi:hypothetical protein Pint_26268 [Pistacia integerrima]|uniref:Uncharacterized protein n=1 Tax=Pistacia integerrima TaxID=434235 RepID=A0ACC0YAL1_9ROSI|nr:hypothetical protein Pint_26268 [Pistacia integerrima]
MIRFQRHFHAQDNDIMLITFPKSGTLWLKALTFTIVNRYQYTQENSPLLIRHDYLRGAISQSQIFGMSWNVQDHCRSMHACMQHRQGMNWVVAVNLQEEMVFHSCMFNASQ